jgi:hypothetical protein
MLKIMYSFILVLFFVSGCSLSFTRPVVPPLPTQLALTGFPASSQAGGLEGIFISSASIPGAGEERCYKLVRFYQDGLFIYSDLACLADGGDRDDLRDEVDEWFNRDNDRVSRGDYALLDGRLWLRVVVHDAVHETTYLRSFQGEACGGEMVLQEPAVRGYAGIPSDLTQPVQEYSLMVRKLSDQAGEDACRLPGFRFVRRIYTALAGNEAVYSIRTGEGQACALVYLAPDGSIWPQEGRAEITSGSDGLCTWRWPVGDQAGMGLVTVTIGGIRQDFEIQIR